MGKLPGYDSSRGITTEPLVKTRNIQSEGQLGRDIATIGKVAQDIAAVWQNAEDFTQTLTNQNNLEKGVNDIMDRAKLDPDYNNSQVYHDDLESIRETSLEGFTNNLARMEFTKTANAQVGQAKVKIDGMFMEKTIDHTKGEIITAHDLNKKVYIKTGDPAFKDKQKSLALKGRSDGFVSEVFLANEIVKVDGWDQLRYLQMAQDGQVREALQLIDESDMKPSEKNAAKGAILTMARQGAIIAEVEQLNREQQMYAETDALIDDPNLSYVEKLDHIEQQEKFGMPAVDANDLRGELNSTNKIAAESHAESKSLILRSIASLNNGIQDKRGKKNWKDIREYLKGVKATRKMISNSHADGVITKADKIKFIEELNKVVKEEKNIAATKIKKQGAGPFGWGYGYNDAYKEISEQLGGVPGLSDEALIEFYDASEENKWKDDQQKIEVQKIIDKYKEQLRIETIDRINQAVGFTPKVIDESESVEDLLQRSNATMADVEAAAKKFGVSNNEVIKRMRAR